MIGPEALRAIDEGADYSALMAAVVQAHISEDATELHRLLDAVDPIEARLTANKLRVVYYYHANSGAVPGRPSSDAARPHGLSVLPQSPMTPATAVRDDGPSEQATAPVLTSPWFDNWSRKVPCA